MDRDAREKLAALEKLLRALAPVAIGFSGGVDSTFLAAVAARAIPGQAMLFHLAGPFVSTPERNASAELSGTLGLSVHTIEIDQLADPAIAANTPDRCYRCKRAGFARIIDAARTWVAERGLAPDAVCVLDGSNADDAAATDRPGMRALAELGVRSPLAETGFTKAEERALLRTWGISIWNMPAGACLATRVAMGEPLTAEKLACARACEDYLHELGCTQVRARIEGDELRIEASPEDLVLIAVGDVAIETKEALPGAVASRIGKGHGDMGAEDRPIEASRIRGDIYAQLSVFAQNAGIPHISPVGHPYRRGSMNHQLRRT